VPLWPHDPRHLRVVLQARHPVLEPRRQRGSGHSAALAGVVRHHHGTEAPRGPALPDGRPQVPGASAVVPLDQIPVQVRAAAHFNRLIRRLQGQRSSEEAVEAALVHCHHGVVRQVPQALGHLYQISEAGKSGARQQDIDADQAPRNLRVLGGLAQVRETVWRREAHDEARLECPLFPYLGAHDSVLEGAEADQLVGGGFAAVVAGRARAAPGCDCTVAHGTAQMDEPGQGMII